jgi:hypothetical protein
MAVRFQAQRPVNSLNGFSCRYHRHADYCTG